ncbi:MAG: hypothetical protein R6U15_00090, partial [Candidatus Izemoplasmatales bacterium]
VKTYLDRLKYALGQSDSRIIFQEYRMVDENRPIEYTNRYTIASLFSDESPSKVMRRELKKLKVNEYMHTVKDLKFKNRSDMFVFAKKYTGFVYIKIRTELISKQHTSNYVFVMSFHFSDKPIKNKYFPYKKKGEKNE